MAVALETRMVRLFPEFKLFACHKWNFSCIIFVCFCLFLSQGLGVLPRPVMKTQTQEVVLPSSPVTVLGGICNCYMPP